jgi:hypothetical protein
MSWRLPRKAGSTPDTANESFGILVDVDTDACFRLDGTGPCTHVCKFRGADGGTRFALKTHSDIQAIVRVQNNSGDPDVWVSYDSCSKHAPVIPCAVHETMCIEPMSESDCDDLRHRLFGDCDDF